MNLQSFMNSLKDQAPPDKLNQYLTALWYDKNNNWDKAHNIIQLINDSTASWIHAYLHRKEGDSFNAAYWYRRANKSKPECSLEHEWEKITKELLERETA